MGGDRMRRRWLRWKLDRSIRRTHADLARLDTSMAAIGMRRPERRRVWREVIAGRLDPNDLIGGGK